MGPEVRCQRSSQNNTHGSAKKSTRLKFRYFSPNGGTRLKRRAVDDRRRPSPADGRTERRLQPAFDPGAENFGRSSKALVPSAHHYGRTGWDVEYPSLWVVLV